MIYVNTEHCNKDKNVDNIKCKIFDLKYYINIDNDNKYNQCED